MLRILRPPFHDALVQAGLTGAGRTGVVFVSDGWELNDYSVEWASRFGFPDWCRLIAWEADWLSPEAPTGLLRFPARGLRLAEPEVFALSPRAVGYVLARPWDHGQAIGVNLARIFASEEVGVFSPALTRREKQHKNGTAVAFSGLNIPSTVSISEPRYSE